VEPSPAQVAYLRRAREPDGQLRVSHGCSTLDQLRASTTCCWRRSWRRGSPGADCELRHRVTPGNPPGDGQGEDAQEPEQDEERHDAHEQLDRRRSQLGDGNDEHGHHTEHDEASFALGAPITPGASCPLAAHPANPTAGLFHRRGGPGGMGQPPSLHSAIPVVQTGHPVTLSASTRDQASWGRSAHGR
jgi:hypothetical protein